MPPRNERRAWILPGLIFSYFLGIFIFVHARPGGQIERDGYFHARAAQTLPARGLSRKFPWTQASIWKETFHDKEFLYHLWLAPFARGESPIRGAAVASSLLAAGIFAGFFLLLRHHAVPWPLLGTTILAAMGGPFLLRLSFVRAHVLSVFLFIIALHFLLSRKPKALAILGAVYAWSYSVPLIFPAFAFLYCLGRKLSGEEADWKLAGAAVAGVVGGLVVHPYTPLSIGSLWTHLQILTIAATQRSLAAIEVAREFAPYGTRDFLLAYPGLVLTAIVLVLGGWRAGKKASAETMGLLTAAAAAFLATLVVSRTIEYAAPLAAAAVMFAARDVFDDETVKSLSAWMKKERRPRFLLKPGFFLIVLGVHTHCLAYVFAMADNNDNPRFHAAAHWMRKNLKEGETVVNLWWDDFPDLYYSAPRQRFLVGLDPTFMLQWDKEKALKLERMRTAREPLDPAWLAETFEARVMILRAPSTRFYQQLQWSVWKPVYADGTAAIYALSGPLGPSSAARGGLPVIQDLTSPPQSR
ncbi:MAG: hypothetical protein COB53_03430 [Elusimicrobia bacterium]|nr:MAG: hypothetical protein COB53_03430 [Elusimicrobiota bacterium]